MLEDRNNALLNGAYAVRAASKASKEMTATSSVFDSRREAKLPRFSWEEIVLGDALGRGGFSDVYEVNMIREKVHTGSVEALGYSSKFPNTIDIGREGANEDDEKAIQLALRHFTTEHCIRRKTDQARYAIKFLSPGTMNDPTLFKTGAADLITETMFLSSLEHPNITKIRGISDQGVYGFASGLKGGFFILLDRLQETLESRLAKWDKEEKKSRRFIRRSLLNKMTRKRFDLFTARLQCALDIAAALAYLHCHNIVFRDLKPENIGVDCRGDFKIFDFGLATELHPNKQLDDCLYDLTGQTGSLRYMAPEVAKNEPYNLSADVYSFSILLWEICSLQRPYDGMDKLSHANLVVYGSHRPTPDSSWCFAVRSLMTRGWNEDIKSRPTMDICYKMIRKEIIVRRDGDDTGLEHTRRRSTYLFKVPSTGTLQSIRRAFGKAIAA